MLCAAIDIGSNTTRVLVAEPTDGQLRKVMEQRAYTRIGKASRHDGKIEAEKIEEVAEVVATQLRLAEEIGPEAIRIVGHAAIRELAHRDGAGPGFHRAAGVPVAAYGPRGSAEAVENIDAAILPGVPAVLLANHGVLVFHRSPELAVLVGGVVEEAAQAALNASRIGGPVVIPEDLRAAALQRAMTFAAAGTRSA